MEQSIGLTLYFISFFLVRCFTTIYLLRRAFKLRLNQVYILGLHVGMGALINLMSFFVQLFARDLIVIIDNALMVLFIHMTFYKGKKSPIYIILPSITIMEILYIILNMSPATNIIASILDNGASIIIGAWFALTSVRVYLKIKNVKSVEPWIKFRYILVILYGISWIFVSIIFLITPNPELISNVQTLILRITFPIMDIIEFIAWVMPSKLKKWINRNYIPLNETLSLSEEELLDSSGNND